MGRAASVFDRDRMAAIDEASQPAFELFIGEQEKSKKRGQNYLIDWRRRFC
jgi:hypothetical protein